MRLTVDSGICEVKNLKHVVVYYVAAFEHTVVIYCAWTRPYSILIGKRSDCVKFVICILLVVIAC